MAEEETKTRSEQTRTNGAGEKQEPEGGRAEPAPEEQSSPAASVQAAPRSRKRRAAESSAEESTKPREEGGGADRGKIAVWAVVGAAVVIGGVLLMRFSSEPGASSETVADITLVTADRTDLDCVAATGIGAYQCGFSDENTPRQVEERDKLRPFMTLGRQLYLIPGLFLEPAVAARYQSEPPNKPRQQLKRFTAKCRIEPVGELEGVRVRWLPSAPWEPPRRVQVVKASDCKIEG